MKKLFIIQKNYNIISKNTTNYHYFFFKDLINFGFILYFLIIRINFKIINYSDIVINDSNL